MRADLMLKFRRFCERDDIDLLTEFAAMKAREARINHEARLLHGACARGVELIRERAQLYRAMAANFDAAADAMNNTLEQPVGDLATAHSAVAGAVRSALHLN